MNKPGKSKEISRNAIKIQYKFILFWTDANRRESLIYPSFNSLSIMGYD